MKTRSLLTLLLASVLLVGCDGQSLPPISSDSSSQGGSETSDSSGASDSTSTTGSDSTSEVTTYSLSYTKGANDPSDLEVEIVYQQEYYEITSAAHEFEEGAELAVSVYTATAGIAVSSVTLNGTALSKNSAGQYPFTMPAQNSAIAVTFASTHALAATYSIDGIAEMYFYEQDTFSADAPQITSAVAGASIFAYLSFNDGYDAADFTIVTKNGETELTPEAAQKAEGHNVYHFTMPDADVSLSVTLTAPTDSWYSYLLTSENVAFEAENNIALTMAEINEYVPFLSRETYEFDNASPLASYDGSSYAWLLSTVEKYADTEAAYYAMFDIDNAIQTILTTDDGWSYDSYYGIYYKYVTDTLQVQVGSTYFENGDETSPYSVGLYFSAYRYVAPTSWTELFTSIDPYYSSYETSGWYNFILTVEEIDANVPLISYRFDGMQMGESKLNSDNYAWTLIRNTSDTTTAGLQEQVDAIDAAAAEVLTEDAGWTKGQVAEGITGYNKRIEGKSIWVYATIYSDYYGEYSYPSLVFDGDIIHDSWGSFLAGGISIEDEYFFAAYSADIDREFPFFESTNTSAVTYFASSLSLYDLVWGIGVDGLATTDDQAAKITEMEAELETVYGAADSGWTKTTITFEGASHTAYSKVSETTGETCYIYVRGLEIEDWYAESGYSYGVFFTFDCTVSSWENYFADKASQEQESTFSMTLQNVKNFVPYWESQYESQLKTYTTESRFTIGCSAWAIGVDGLTATEQADVIKNLSGELQTNLTNSSLGADYTLVSIGEGESAFNAYLLESTYDYTKYYVYIEDFSETDAQGNTTYGARIVFDAELNWGSLTTRRSAELSESWYTYSVSLATIIENVPYVATIEWSRITYLDSTLNEGERVWYVYFDSTTETIDADMATVLAAVKGALTDFTYDEANSQFTKVLSETETLVVMLTTNSSNDEIRLVFDVIRTTTTPAA